MKTFKELGIRQDLIERLKTRYILKPTAIQSLVIPKLLEKESAAQRSFLFRSETGTGKTFAYLLPILSINDVFSAQRELSVLICAPTFELCSQIKEELDFLLETSNLKSVKTELLIGSASIEKQIDNLRRHKPSIAIGNPGRLFALAKMGKLKLNNLRYLILDEADRLTAQECIEDTLGLLNIAAKSAPCVCAAGCSATIGKKSKEQLGRLFKGAEIIESDDNEILRGQIEHWAIFGERRKRVQTLRSFIASIIGQTGKSKKSKIKILVFTSKNDDAAVIHSQLMHHKIAAEGLYGKVNKKPLSAEQRKQSLDSFRRGAAQVLVATDLAARGLDIRGITHVVALDVPEDTGIYIHRAGRTARAGKRGIMVTIGDETRMRILSILEKKLKIRITPKELYGGRILPVAFSSE